MSERPIVYLDVDDTVLEFPGRRLGGEASAKLFYTLYQSGKAAIGAGDFVRWLAQHCEVRWLTAWCPSGTMDEVSRDRLAMLLEVPVEVIAPFYNPMPWPNCKTDGIDFSETRPWLHVEDHINEKEKAAYDKHGLRDRFVRCNVSEHPADLLRAWVKVADTFNLPLPSREDFHHRNMHRAFPRETNMQSIQLPHGDPK